MATEHKFLLGCALLAYASAAWAQATEAPIKPLPAIDRHVRTDRTVDQLVPVVTVEQLSTFHTVLQGYRLQIFRDGAVLYHGHKDVKTLGEVRFYIKPEQVNKIIEDFRRSMFWMVPEDQYGLLDGAVDAPKRVFTVRDGTNSRTVRFASQNQGVFLLKIVEDEVNTARWRCPFDLQDRSIELCAAAKEYEQYAISDFLKADLPRLKEIYK